MLTSPLRAYRVSGRTGAKLDRSKSAGQPSARQSRARLERAEAIPTCRRARSASARGRAALARARDRRVRRRRGHDRGPWVRRRLVAAAGLLYEITYAFPTVAG